MAPIRATEHRIGQFGESCPIYTNASPFLPHCLRAFALPGKPAYAAGYGNDAYPLFRVVRVPDNGGFIAHRCQMPVDAVLGDVQLSSFEPFYPGLL